MRPLVDGSASAPAGIAGTLYRGSSAFLAVYLIGAAIGFVIQLAIARLLGAEAFGHYVYAVSWVPLLLLGCNFGLKPTVVRFVAAYNARDQIGLLRGLVRSATLWSAAASIVVVLLGLGALWLLDRCIDKPVGALALMVLAMPFLALGDVWSSVVRGSGAVVRSQIPASLVQQTVFGGAFIALVMLHGAGGGAAIATGAFLLASIGAMLSAGWLMRGRLAGDSRAGRLQRETGAWLHVAWGNALIATFQAVRGPLIVVIAGAYVEAQQLAFFGAAQRLANVISLGLMAISASASPKISEYFALSDFAGLRRLARAAARGALAAAIAIATLMTLFGHPLLRLFGDGFDAAYIALLVLLAGETVAAAAGPVGFLLSMTGLHRAAAWIEGVTSAFVVFLAFLIVPRHGILGAAIAIATGSALRNAAMALVARQRLGLREAAGD